jgi:hypothetical protein
MDGVWIDPVTAQLMMILAMVVMSSRFLIQAE